MILFIVGIVGILLGAQIYLRPLSPHHARLLFLCSVMGVMFFLVVQSYSEYQRFSGGLLGFLERKEGLLWFFPYIRFHIWNTYIVSLLIAGMAFLLGRWWNVRAQGILFKDDELWIMATSIFLIGYPGILFYIPMVLLVGFVGSLLLRIVLKHHERFSLYYVWAPVALFGILIIHYSVRYEAWWMSFRF